MGWRAKEDALLSRLRILVVGAGGVGCELLKNLVLTGFKHIHVIDLDTIDVSNLNRQFLFRREHVGKSKAEVATEAVRGLLPDVDISYDHDSIFNCEKFNLPFYEQFTIVINALDNKAARSHVNRMCLSAKVPLIESGSSGFMGQARVIMRDLSECYDCETKEAVQKTFPGCTIRNTPSEHIHCTVWAKHVFNQLFGEMDIDDDVSPDINDEHNKENGDGEKVLQENKTEEKERNGDQKNDEEHRQNGEVKEKGEEPPTNTRVWAEKVNYDPKLILNKLFKTDIEYLCSMKNLWKERKQPVPLDMDNLAENSASLEGVGGTGFDDVNTVWSVARCVRVASDCIEVLRERKAALPSGEILVWDKDDDTAMRFVAACANIRAAIFHIDTKTLFDIKSMAGNIIPAIATTNAMVAGMAVTEALKVAHQQFSRIASVFIALHPNPRGKLLVDEPCRPPNPKCYVCSAKHEIHLTVNMQEMTIKTLRDDILKSALNMLEPDVMDFTTKRIILSSDEDDMAPGFEKKKLGELSLTNGAMLECDDYAQNFALKLFLFHNDKMNADEFKIGSQSDLTSATKAESMDVSLDDSRKRKTIREGVQELEVERKKARVDGEREE